MKNKEIIADIEIIQRAIDLLEGKGVEYFIIDQNLFSINKISTILKPYVNTSNDVFDKIAIIEFAYSDKVMPMNVKIVSQFENESCLEFVKSSKMINETQLATIIGKTQECFKENYNYDDEKLKQILDDTVLNETIMLLINGINKEDCENVKNDFTSKFEAWKERQHNKNEEMMDAIQTLFTKLMYAKVIKK